MALTIDGSDPSGDLGDLLDAKLNLAGGKVLQVVRATDTTVRTTTSTSYVDASISVTITLQKSDSTVLLIWSLNMAHSGSSDFSGMQITDSSNNAISGAQDTFVGSNTTNTVQAHATLIGYATPATTSATTYKGRFKVNASGTATISNANVTGQLYAIEVSA